MLDAAKSIYTQTSFVGGMNMLGDDTRIANNQYRVGFNLRNRFDQLDEIPSSIVDTNAPYGNKQELVTFGIYLLLFVEGNAYYKLYTDTQWTKIDDFLMSAVAPRYWTKAVPVSTTNYLRIAATSTIPIQVGSNGVVTATQNIANSAGAVNVNNVAGAAEGNLPGLLVQDNINQPWFIFLNANGMPVARKTQEYSQWQITFTDATNTVVRNDPPSMAGNTSYIPIGDMREYVPIGNYMEYLNGILYIASQDGEFIYQSVTGRPLDFVRNVVNTLATANTNPPYTQYPGGDATTTSYSVGVGPISCLRASSNSGLFVSAGNANFNVTLNITPNVILQFGEYPLIRTFLFNAICLSDRAIFDSIGDTRFITLGGVRSFNAIEQTQNEGRNLPFTATVQKAFNNIIQNPFYSAAILFNDYELYAVTTIFGPAILVYDTITNSWTSFDIAQTNGKRIKAFAKIELSVLALFAITEDDQVVQLYGSTTQNDDASVRTKGICSLPQLTEQYTIAPSAHIEIKADSCRVILNEITENANCDCTLYVNNRLSRFGKIPKEITYSPPVIEDDSIYALDDVNTQLMNLFFDLNGTEQGWKLFSVLDWSNGSITQFSIESTNLTPRNPLNSQVSSK